MFFNNFMKNKITEPQKITCEYCGKSFASSLEYSNHISQCLLETNPIAAYFTNSLSFEEESKKISECYNRLSQKGVCFPEDNFFKELLLFLLDENIIQKPRPGDETDSYFSKSPSSQKIERVWKNDLTPESMNRKNQTIEGKLNNLLSRVRRCPSCERGFITKNGSVYCSKDCKNKARYLRENKILPTITTLCEFCHKPMNRRAGARTHSACRQKLWKKNRAEKNIIFS